MNNMSLYNITNNFVDLMDKVQDGTITEEEYNELGEELALELQKKSGNIAGYIQDRNALIDAIDVQIKRLQDYKKSEQNKIDAQKFSVEKEVAAMAKIYKEVVGDQLFNSRS